MTNTQSEQPQVAHESSETHGLARILPGTTGLAAVRDYGVAASVLLIFLALALRSDAFLSQSNLANILDQWSLIGIIVCGMTVNIIAGGFDLSVTAVFALAGVAAAKVAIVTDQVALGLATGVLVGLALGVVNGVLITYGRLDKFVGTIATSVMFLGIAQLVSDNSLLIVDDDAFSTVGNAYVGSLTLYTVVFIVVAALCALFLSRTLLGHHCYAVGGNPEAARYAGIPNGRIMVMSYAFSGVCAGIAGVLAASRNSVGSADIRVDFAFQAATAIVIGGVSVFGGRGSIGRALLGVALLALIGNGFNLLNVDPAYQGLLQGVIIVVAMAIDALARRESS